MGLHPIRPGSGGLRLREVHAYYANAATAQTPPPPPPALARIEPGPAQQREGELYKFLGQSGTLAFDALLNGLDRKPDLLGRIACTVAFYKVEDHVAPRLPVEVGAKLVQDLACLYPEDAGLGSGVVCIRAA